MGLAGLERDIKDALYSQRIKIEQALALSELEGFARVEVLSKGAS